MLTPPITCDAILFDLDGVLIDSSRSIIRHWQEWAAEHNLEIARILSIAHGMRTIETIRAVAPHLDAAAETEHFTAHEVEDTAGVVAIPGAHAILAGLPPQAWALVTSGSAALVRARLAATGLPVPPVLVSGDDVRRGKPDPEPYLTGAARLGVPVKRCVVIEDAPAGIRAGKQAGMRVVAIASTHTRLHLQETGADLILDRLTDLCIRPAADGRLFILQPAPQADQD